MFRDKARRLDRVEMTSKSEFREALSRFPTGVTVLALRSPNGMLAGLTVSAFTSVSLEPPMVLACVDARSRCVPALLEEQPFAFSILSEDQADVAGHFASPIADKFSDVPYRDGDNGAPLIRGACAHIECSVADCHRGGDHVIVVGAVQRIVVSHNRPLVYAMRNFHRLNAPLGAIARGTGPAPEAI